MFRKHLIRWAGGVAAILSAGSAIALQLDFPLACTIGKDCWIIQYPDQRPGSDYGDYACWRRSYNAHQGTDIGIQDVGAMARGVTVLAAAAGKVAAVRDGMADRRYDPQAAGDIKNRECGNAVRIDHGEGWQTLYCHMREHSIAVAAGQSVASGTPLGLVGMSGEAQFPHVHLQVLKDGRNLDPFTGAPVEAGNPSCGLGAGQLWSQRALPQVAYRFADVVRLDFSADPPDLSAPESPSTPVLQQLSATAPALYLWGVVYGARSGDVFTLRIRDGSGRIVANRQDTLAKDQIRVSRLIGIRFAAPQRSPGHYLGEISISHGAQTTRAERLLPVVP